MAASSRIASGALLDPSRQYSCLLLVRTYNKDGVIARDRPYQLRPVGLVQGRRHRLRAANYRLHHKKILRRAHIEHEQVRIVHEGLDEPGLLLVAVRQLVDRSVEVEPQHGGERLDPAAPRTLAERRERLEVVPHVHPLVVGLTTNGVPNGNFAVAPACFDTPNRN